MGFPGFCAFFPARPPVASAGSAQPPYPMLNAIESLHPPAVLVVSIIGFVFGGLWYSPMLFSKLWMAELKMTPESFKSSGGGPVSMLWGFLLTIVSTSALAVLIAARHSSGAMKGAELGLFVGAGLVASREATSCVFERRGLRYFFIVAGHDVAQFTLVGAILAVWR
jgi:hypothetical protein